jgi:hypothetical protein
MALTDLMTLPYIHRRKASTTNAMGQESGQDWNQISATFKGRLSALSSSEIQGFAVQGLDFTHTLYTLEDGFNVGDRVDLPLESVDRKFKVGGNTRHQSVDGDIPTFSEVILTELRVA